MAHRERRRADPDRIRIRGIRAAALLLAVVAAIAGALGSQAPPFSGSAASSRAASPIGDVRSRQRPPRERHGALGEAGGALPAHTTVFDDARPGVANLDPTLRDALRKATAEAAVEGVELFVDSGWRSPEYQEQLLQEAVLEYGSEEEAARWVATPTTSAHVSGNAVDVGRSDAAAWLSDHGAAYGLCQVYGNEPWHYELRPDAVGHACPPVYADPTQDPRMDQ